MKAETTRRPLLSCMGQCVAHEVHAAALPGSVERRVLDAVMSIGDDELDAAQVAANELA